MATNSSKEAAARDAITRIYTNAYSTTTNVTHSFTAIKEILLTQTGKEHQERRLTPERHFESII